jgi:hypothetical protein
LGKRNVGHGETQSRRVGALSRDRRDADYLFGVITEEELIEQQAKVLAAAHAAASWVRARRATWGDERDIAATVGRSAMAPVGTPRALVEAPLEAPAEAGGTFAKVNERGEASQTLSTFSKLLSHARRYLMGFKTRWLLGIGAASFVAGVIMAARHLPPAATASLTSIQLPRLLDSANSLTSIQLPRLLESGNTGATPSQPAPTPSAKTTGTLNILSTPEGTRVLVDGSVRGLTPLSIDGIAAGRHVVVLESPSGVVQRSVTVPADKVTEINESIMAAFVTILSPFEVSIAEGTRAFRLDDHNEFTLAAGPHDLRLTNRRLMFEDRRHVDLAPGQRLTISVTPPQSTVSVTASEQAEVWVDGARVGQTPLADHVVELGAHEILLRRADGGERRVTAMVTVKPFALHVDFSK